MWFLIVSSPDFCHLSYFEVEKEYKYLGILFTISGKFSKIVSEYDQEIPQSQTVDNPLHREEEPLNHHETPGRQIKQSNQLSLPHQDDCNTRMDTK